MTPHSTTRRTGSPLQGWVARSVIAVLAVGTIVAGCGAGDDVTADDAWARPTPPSATVAAFYAVYKNDTGSPDTLTEAYSPQCGRIELHDTEMVDGVMQMRPAQASDLLIPGGGELVLEPGGLHLMCIDVVEPFVEGEEVTLEVTFEDNGVVIVDVPVEQR